MSKITFLNDHWFWQIVAGGIILLIVFIWKEFALPTRRRLIINVLLSVFAIASLVLIALKPALPSSDTAGKTVLLTPGYERTQLDSLEKKHRKLKVLDYNSRELLREDIQAAEVVYLLGFGIPEYDLQRFKNIPVTYLPGRLPEGVVKVRFKEKTAVGDDVKIEGLYRRPKPGNWLILQGPGGTGLDSVMLNDRDEQDFQLVTEVKAAGNFVYFLTEKNPDGEVLTQDPVPMQVDKKVDLKILILNNFPTFETKYLKNFLAGAGHKLVVKSQITSGKFKYEYFNTSRTVVGSLSRETLEPYDLLIVDAVTLRSLARSQSGAIENAVREDGMGVFVQPDETFFNSPGNLINLKFQRQLNKEVKLNEWPDVTISKFPFFIISSPGMESIYSANNSVMAGYNRRTRGRIGTTVLSNTWQLVLEGKPSTYKEIWSRLIGQLSKRNNDSVQIQQQDGFVFPHEPYHFKIRSLRTNPNLTNETGRTIPLIQDVNFPEQWHGTVWPREQGWQKLYYDTSAVFNYYAFESGSWNSLIAEQTLEKNRKYFETPLKKDSREGPVVPINSFWFYGIFLICMGGLWLDPKLS